MTTRVYAVIAYDHYYPSGDNTRGVFHSYGLAVAFLETLKVNDQDGYPRDVYKVVEWEVQ